VQREDPDVETVEGRDADDLGKATGAGPLRLTAGTTRPTANRVLKDAESEGLIALARGRVDVLDRAGLARRARL